MATNILFRRGAQTNLPTTAVDGVFYLTTDTNRLYVGQGTKMALLNQTVQIVSAVSALPTSAQINDFFYCTAENVLAVYTTVDGINKWVQINPDHNDNDDTYVSGLTISEGAAGTNKIDYTVTLSQKKVDKDGKEYTGDKAPKDITATLSLTAADIKEIYPISVGVQAKAGTTGTAVISTTGDNADTSKTVTIKQGANVTVSVDSNNVVTIDAGDSGNTTYELSAESVSGKAVVRLTDSGDGENDVTFAAGKNLTVSANAATDTITYTHETINRTDVPASGATNVAEDRTFEAITAVASDNGHVTGVTTTKFQLPTDKNTTIVGDATVVDWKGTFSDSDGANHVVDFTTTAEALEEELRKAIEDGLAAANTAMTYKGTIALESELPTSSVEIGDVYMLSANDGEKEIGDMFIATVANMETDQIGGIISEGKVVWTYVPSGNDMHTDTKFEGDVAVSQTEVSFKVINTTEDNKTAGDTLKLKPGAKIDFSIPESGVAAIDHEKITTAHTTGTATTLEESGKFTVVTGVTDDTYGHITGYTTTEFTLPTPEKAVEHNLVGKDNKIILAKDGAEDDYVSVEGNAWINATVASDKVTIAHKSTAGSGKAVTVTNESSLAHGGKLNVLSGVTYDDAGHVTSVSTQELTLPTQPEDKDTTYDLYVGATNSATSTPISATANPYVNLKDKSGAIDAVQFVSNSDNLEVTGNGNAITMNLVWGTF